MEHLKILEIGFAYNGHQQIICPVILQDKDETVLVDCGYAGFMPLIREAAASQGIAPGELTGIIITHHDIDHVGGLFEFSNAYPGVKVYASWPTARYLSGKEKPARLVQAEMIYASLPDDQKEGALAFQRMLENIKHVNVDHILTENEVLPFCGGVEIVTTPGHMPGHISLYLRKTKALIAADALVYENDHFEIANPQFTIDLSEAVNSVKKLLSYDISGIICYHGGWVEKDISKKLNELIARYPGS